MARDNRACSETHLCHLNNELTRKIGLRTLLSHYLIIIVIYKEHALKACAETVYCFVLQNNTHSCEIPDF